MQCKLTTQIIMKFQLTKNYYRSLLFSDFYPLCGYSRYKAHASLVIFPNFYKASWYFAFVKLNRKCVFKKSRNSLPIRYGFYHFSFDYKPPSSKIFGISVYCMLMNLITKKNYEKVCLEGA